MRIDCGEIYRRCEEGEKILIVSKKPTRTSSDHIGKGSLHVRCHAESGLKSVTVDTVIYTDPPPDNVRALCAHLVRLSRRPLIIHSY